MASSRHCSVFHSIINKPPFYETHNVAFVKKKVLSFVWVPVKVNRLTNFTQKYIYSKHDLRCCSLILLVGFAYFFATHVVTIVDTSLHNVQHLV